MPVADISTMNEHEGKPAGVSLRALIADAIIAAFLRRYPEDAIPFVYNLLDYLLIALPEGSELWLGQDGSATAISTRSGGCERIPRTAIKVDAPFLGDLELHWTPSPALIGDYVKERETVALISEEILTLGFARRSGLKGQMAGFLAKGQQVLYDHFHRLQDELLGCRDTTRKWPSDVSVLEQVVRQTANHFGPLIRRSGAQYTLVLRYWPDDQGRLVDLGASCDAQALAPPSAEVARSAQQVFDTGFARWCKVDHGVQMSIPCHVLGVPWLVMSRSEDAVSESAQWWAYSIYRDNSLLNSILRDESDRCLAEAMRVPLADATSQEWSDRVKETVTKRWSQIPRVHPVSSPLMEDATQAGGDTQDELVIHGRRYRVCFAPELNPLFTRARLPASASNEGWSSKDPRAAAHFFDKLQKEFNRIHAERQAAENVAKKSAIRHYGHTMGHRLAPVVAYFNQNAVNNEAANCARFVADISLVLQAYSAESREEFFAMNAEKADRFVERERPLDLRSLLENDVAKVSSKDVQTVDGVVHRYPLFSVAIACALIEVVIRDPIQKRTCRLHDAYFGQLLGELALNAVQHGWTKVGSGSILDKVGVPVHVSAIDIDGNQALVLSNYYTVEHKTAPDFFLPTWRRWPSGRANDGPGMAIDVFRRINAGDMFLRSDPPTRDEPGQLHVAVSFEGLTIT